MVPEDKEYDMTEYMAASFGGEFIRSIIIVVNMLFTIIYFAVLIRILISWVSADPYNPIVQVIYAITEPMLKPFRRMLPPLGGFDLSPILFFIALFLVQSLVMGMLKSLLIR